MHAIFMKPSKAFQCFHGAALFRVLLSLRCCLSRNVKILQATPTDTHLSCELLKGFWESSRFVQSSLAEVCERVSPPGPEGALFQHSVEVPLLRSELFKDLR